MSALTRTIPAASSSPWAGLKVIRDDAEKKIILAVLGHSGVAAMVTLDVAGWHDLLQCVALPPDLPAVVTPTAVLKKRSVKKARAS